MAKKSKGPCLPDWQTILAMAPKYLDGGYPIPAAAYVLTDFAKYLKDPSQYMKDEKLKIKYLLNAFSIIGIDTSTELVKDYLLNYTKSLFCYGTEILENTDYDSVLRE